MEETLNQIRETFNLNFNQSTAHNKKCEEIFAPAGANSNFPPTNIQHIDVEGTLMQLLHHQKREIVLAACIKFLVNLTTVLQFIRQTIALNIKQ